ncbi:MAG: YbaK/EbsC family protein, partial [Gaiellaceae bacterium]
TAARIAKAAEVLEATGFEPGAVAPFPLPKVDRVLIDQNLLGHDVVWVGAGSTTHMASLNPGVLVRLARARSMDVVQDSTYHSA